MDESFLLLLLLLSFLFLFLFLFVCFCLFSFFARGRSSSGKTLDPVFVLGFVPLTPPPHTHTHTHTPCHLPSPSSPILPTLIGRSSGVKFYFEETGLRPSDPRCSPKSWSPISARSTSPGRVSQGCLRRCQRKCIKFPLSTHAHARARTSWLSAVG